MTIKGLMTIICGSNIVLVVIAVLLIFTLNTRFHDLTDASNNRYQSYLLADELRQSSDDLTRLGRTYAITGDDKYEKMYMDILDIRNGKKARPEEYHKIYWDLVLNYGDKPKPDDKTVSLKTLMEELHFSDAEFRLLSEAQGNSDALVGLEVKAMNAVKGNFADEAGNYTVRGEPDFKMARELLHSNTYHSEKAKIMAPIDRFFGELEGRTQDELNQAKDSVETLVNSMTVVLLLMLASAFISFFMIQQRVNKRINGLVERLHEIGQNADLTTKMAARQNDEVGYIADNVGIMLARFRDAIAKIHSVSGSIQHNSSTIFDFIQSGHHLSSQQKSETNMAAAAIEEMTAALSEVARNTSEADSYTKETDSYANKGKQIVANTIRQIQELSQEFEETSTVVNELADESNKVGSVLIVIKSIAEQTNLLALNAAIEAARAGEQGRGFAVVADEVRSLAQKTQESTQEIEEMIDQLQQKSSAAVRSIQSGAVRLTETTGAAEEADSALINIVDSMQKLANLTSAIAAATEEQTTVSAEISKNIVNINESSDRIAEGFGDLTDSADNLKTASDEMVESVSIFKV